MIATTYTDQNINNVNVQHQTQTIISIILPNSNVFN